MTRIHYQLPIAAVVVIVLTASGGAVNTGVAAAKSCSARPFSIQFTPITLARGRLSWKARGTRGAWRVARDGRTVGQTRRRTISIRYSPGRPFTVRVLSVGAGRHCAAARRIFFAKPRPAKVNRPFVYLDRPDRATVSWEPASSSLSAVVGYRVYRNGKLL